MEEHGGMARFGRFARGRRIAGRKYDGDIAGARRRWQHGIFVDWQLSRHSGLQLFQFLRTSSGVIGG